MHGWSNSRILRSPVPPTRQQASSTWTRPLCDEERHHSVAGRTFSSRVVNPCSLNLITMPSIQSYSRLISDAAVPAGADHGGKAQDATGNTVNCKPFRFPVGLLEKIVHEASASDLVAIGSTNDILRNRYASPPVQNPAFRLFR
ncbi:hypothetical protein JAAARDRAFT_423834 [Jaapia argillacea MUCL 33604]|uniref:Uncharacterized protein n=1 Tax=Jaapia argillacea MUCL 33604 TaxID=933084 RepID=A0A067PG70_9AGAM|nr:hypothetical protein JAAARDRAFT_423834 [Jaapia argillacea MUCL 33604]